MNAMSILFPKLHFHPDETPISWAARQAAFHTGGRVVPFLNDLKISVLDLARGKKEAIERLCTIAGQDPTPVLANAITALSNRRYMLRGCEFSAEFTTGVVTRFCPLCLEEDRMGRGLPNAAIRHRLNWRLAPIRTCVKHNIALKDVRIGKWSDMLHELQVLDSAVLRGITEAKKVELRNPSPLQGYVEGRLKGKIGPEWLDVQEVDQACRATEMLGGLMAFGPDQKAAKMSNDMWEKAGRVGWPMVNEGGAAIHDFLRNQLLSGVRTNGYPSPRNSFGMLYGWLFASRLSKEPGPIRDIVRNILVENIPLVPGQMLLGKPITSPRLVSVASIAKAEGLNSKTLANVLKLAGVVDDTPRLRHGHKMVAEYELAKPLIERARHAVPVKQVPDILTASRPIVFFLIQMEQLHRVQDHDGLESKVGKAIDGRSIRRVLEFIEGNFDAVDVVPEGHVSLAKAAEKTRINLQIILELLFERHLKAVCRISDKKGFEAILVSPDEIVACNENYLPAASDATLFWGT